MDLKAEFLHGPLALFQRLSADHSSAVEFDLGDETALFLNDPAAIADVLWKKAHNFRKVLGFRRAREFVDDGLFDRRHRWEVAPTCCDIPEIIQRHGITRAWKNGTEVNLTHAVKKLSFVAICQGVGGLREPQAWQELEDALSSIIRSLDRVTLAFPECPSILELATADEFEHARAVLANAFADLPGEYTGYVRTRSITALLAGYEQIAAVLITTLSLLSSAPEVAERVVSEAIEVPRQPRSGSPARSLTSAVVQESLRLYPPVWMLARRAITDCSIAGHGVRLGTVVLMCQYTVHRSERFFPQPLLFVPERWQTACASNAPLFSFFPFSYGPRACKGESFVREVVTSALWALLPIWRICVREMPQYAARITLQPADSVMARTYVRGTANIT